MPIRRRVRHAQHGSVAQATVHPVSLAATVLQHAGKISIGVLALATILDLKPKPKPNITSSRRCRGEVGLAVAQRVLARPELAGLELFSFRAYGSRKRLVIRLDKVSSELSNQGLHPGPFVGCTPYLQ